MSPRRHFPPPVCQRRPQEAHAAPSPCTAQHMNLFPHMAPAPRPAPGAALLGTPRGPPHAPHPSDWSCCREPPAHPALPATSPEPQRAPCCAPGPLSACPPRCPQRVGALGTPSSPHTCPRPCWSLQRHRLEQNHRTSASCCLLHSSRQRRTGTRLLRDRCPCTPSRSTASTCTNSSHSPAAGGTDRQHLASLFPKGPCLHPKEPPERPSQAGPPAGDGGARCQHKVSPPARQGSIRAPEPRYTLITLEVTGLRGGLKRNRLLFTDTIWTQAISSPAHHGPGEQQCARGVVGVRAAPPASGAPSRLRCGTARGRRLADTGGRGVRGRELGAVGSARGRGRSPRAATRGVRGSLGTSSRGHQGTPRAAHPGGLGAGWEPPAPPAPPASIPKPSPPELPVQGGAGVAPRPGAAVPCAGRSGAPRPCPAPARAQPAKRGRGARSRGTQRSPARNPTEPRGHRAPA